MDSLQVQVTNLSRKVDALYQITEQLSQQMSEILAERPSHQHASVQATPNTQISTVEEPATQQSARNSSTHLFDEYKDILLEETSDLEGGYHQGDRAITPEIQVQRLTAQLTAAYNRIAVLEEQLLSLRHHS
ncbi:hypothetical protein [Geitlerinema sp. PCC 9228]|jgi:hypothetical protein|uniref:hypothetical protein n=1 Tax=Geitlerinema sp. PCC 9228 TaxID=111611 RepID=UPI0008F9D99E|nr:hypothetical protein [Geitlerinema sp. PCC 9228]